MENESLRLVVDPDVGGSVLALERRHAIGFQPLLRPTARPLARSSNASSFTLAPYSNRIRDGVFRFEGRIYTLRHPEKHAIHGDVRDRRWRVVSQGRDACELELDARTLADWNFPFPILCRVRFGLEGARATFALSLENVSGARMPAGFGFHPYFVRALEPGDAVEIELRVRGVYPGDTPLPTGPPVPLPPEQDFSLRRALDVTLDHCFAGWDGRARIVWPRSGVSLRMQASDAFGHAIVYSPPGEPFFAIEPVTNANDGFNLLAAGQADTGVVVLEPGATLEGRVELALEG